MNPMDSQDRSRERAEMSCPPSGEERGLRAWWRGTCPAQKIRLLTIPFWIWLIVRGR